MPRGAIGEMVVRGSGILLGYWNQPVATAETVRDGWLHTGDIATMDADGFVTIMDRVKDMLIRGGENIYCVEIEEVLASHPDVLEAAVFGLPERVLGEVVGAAICLRGGGTADEACPLPGPSRLGRFADDADDAAAVPPFPQVA